MDSPEAKSSTPSPRAAAPYRWETHPTDLDEMPPVLAGASEPSTTLAVSHGRLEKINAQRARIILEANVQYPPMAALHPQIAAEQIVLPPQIPLVEPSRLDVGRQIAYGIATADLPGKLEAGFIAGVRAAVAILKGEIRTPNPILDDTTKVLTELHTALREHNSLAQIKFAVKQAISTLNRILANPEQHQEIFLLSDPGKVGEAMLLSDADMRALIQQIRTNVYQLDLYLNFLKGKGDYACTEDDLNNQRNAIIRSLLTPQETRSLLLSQDPPSHQGLLARLIRIRKSQQGGLAEGIQKLLSSLIQTTFKAAKEFVGWAESKPLLEDDQVDLPKQELSDDGLTITPHHIHKKSTLKTLVEWGTDLFKSSSDVSGAHLFGSVLLTSLESARTYLQSDGKVLLSEIDNPTASAEHPIITSLNVCITLMQSTLESKTVSVADIRAVVSQIKGRLVDHHTLWLGSLVNLGITSDKTGNPIKILMEMKKHLKETDPNPEKAAAANSLQQKTAALADEVAEIGSFQATFEACSWWLGKRDPVVEEKRTKIRVVAFSTLLKESGYICYKKDDQKNKVAFLKALNGYITQSTDIGIIKRAFMQLCTPLILWLCKHCVTTLKKGAFGALTDYVNGAVDFASGAADINPVQRLGAVFSNFNEAHRASVTNIDPNNDVGLEEHLNGNEKNEIIGSVKFLQSKKTKCTTIEAVYKKAGETVVTKYMGKFNPTRHLTKVTDAIKIWASDSQYRYLPNVYWLITYIPIAVIAGFNNIVVFPLFEWLPNKVTNYVVKLILEKGKVVENGHTLLRGAIFPPDTKGRPTNKLMNGVLISILEKLTDLLEEQSTSDGNVSAPRSKKISDPELSKTICKMLTFLGLKEQVHDSTTLAAYDASNAPSGLSPLLEQIYRFIRGKGSKSLDMHVASAIENLLAECFELLMHPDILNQQVVFALTNMRDSMIAVPSVAPVEPAQPVVVLPPPLIPEKIAPTDLDRITELKTYAIHLAAHLTHDPLTKCKVHDKPIRDHVASIMGRLIGSPDHPSLIQSWKDLYDATGHASIEDSKRLFDELGTLIHDIESELFHLKNEVQNETVGAASLKKHEAFLAPLLDSLKGYEATFSTLYTAEALDSMKCKGELSGTLNTTMIAFEALLTSSTSEALTNSLLAVNGQIDIFKALLTNQFLPLPIREFLANSASLAADTTYLDSFINLETFHKFSTKWLAETAASIQGSITPNKRVRKLKDYFLRINTSIINLPEFKEIKKLQDAIITLFEQAAPGEELQDITPSLDELNQLISKTNQDFALKHKDVKERVRLTIASLNERALQIRTILDPSLVAAVPIEEEDASHSDEDFMDFDPAIAVIPDPRIASAHAVVDIHMKLDAIAKAATELEAVSSINFPLDWFPLFNTTESKIVDILLERITAFENIILRNPQLIMGIVNYLGVINFVQPKPATVPEAVAS